MSYYIIPKINNCINVNPKHGDNYDESLKPYISSSLFHYYKEIREEIQRYFQNMNSTNSMNSMNNMNSEISYEEIIKIVNPYEYIFSKVPGSKFSVSKLKPQTNFFYDFLEVSITLNIFEQYKNKNITSLHLTNNNIDSIDCFEMLRENYNDEIIYYDTINDEIISSIGEKRFDFIFFETNLSDYNSYIISLIQCLMLILRNQLSGGTCVIKIDNLFHKPIVDVLYILSSLYEKVYILKPNTSNITTFDKYIICKNFFFNEDKIRYFKLNYYKLVVFLKKLENRHIESILDFDIPYYFTIKLEDMNIIIGQQQIDSLNLIMSILKNKNKEEKIDTIKKSNIQKSVSWCEKYKIPFNKFSEKTNIFLPITKCNKEQELNKEKYIKEFYSEQEKEQEQEQETENCIIDSFV
jgi:hypothetical protein